MIININLVIITSNCFINEGSHLQQKRLIAFEEIYLLMSLVKIIYNRDTDELN
jgi:hypothetical protein